MKGKFYNETVADEATRGVLCMPVKIEAINNSGRRDMRLLAILTECAADKHLSALRPTHF